VKITAWFKKLLGRSPHDGDEEKKPVGDVNEAFTTSFGQATSSYVPSQQDRPPH
jgi:hypothetical protein